jgi:hypothetical protein
MIRPTIQLFLILLTPVWSIDLAETVAGSLSPDQRSIELSYRSQCSRFVSGHVLVPVSKNSLKLGVALHPSRMTCTKIMPKEISTIDYLQTNHLKSIKVMNSYSLPKARIIEAPLGWSEDKIVFNDSPCRPVRGFYIDQRNQIFTVRESASEKKRCTDKHREQKLAHFFSKKPSIPKGSQAQIRMTGVRKVSKITDDQYTFQVAHRCDEAPLGIVLKKNLVHIALIRSPKINCKKVRVSAVKLRGVKFLAGTKVAQDDTKKKKIRYRIVHLAPVAKLSDHQNGIAVKSFDLVDDILIRSQSNQIFLTAIQEAIATPHKSSQKIIGLKLLQPTFPLKLQSRYL